MQIPMRMKSLIHWERGFREFGPPRESPQYSKLDMDGAIKTHENW